MVQATKRAMSHIRRVLWRNGRPPEGADNGALEDSMGAIPQFEDRSGAMPDAAPPLGGRDHQPATEPQLKYIKVLGGDPSGVGSKREASDLINRLLSLRGRRPLDPKLLAQRGAKAGVETNGEWKSAHHSLLATLRLDLQEYVDLSLGNLRAKLSDPLGPGGSNQSQGPDEMVRRAEEELKQLELCRKWGYSVASLPSLSPTEVPSLGHPEPRMQAASAYTNPRDDGSKVHWIRWLGLIAIFTVFVMIEAVANIGLLMDALPGGALAAFLLAVLVSVVNVGGFGISAGLFLSWLRRHFGRQRHRLHQVAWGSWAVSAFAFNLVAGRHREAYARVVDQIQETPTAPVPAARDLLSQVSFNPLTWEFQALLFALLGMLLCALGCAKGFTFIRGPVDDSQTDNPGVTKDEGDAQGEPADAGGVSEAAPHHRQLFDAFATLPQRYQGRLTNDLRGDVASWYRALDQERRAVTTLLEKLKEEQNRSALIDTVEHAFIVAHNSNYPDKIDLQSVEAHRLEKYPEPLAVTASDPQVMDVAGALVTEWRESGQAEFDKRIAEANEKITAVWNNYRPLVLGEPGRFVSSGEAAAPAAPRS